MEIMNQNFEGLKNGLAVERERERMLLLGQERLDS